MKKYIVAICAFGISMFCAVSAQDHPSVLVFSKTAGFRHDSIEKGAAALQRLGEQHDIRVDHTEDAAWFTKENLQQYRAIIFLSTTGEILNAKQKAAFVDFIQEGKGFVGIHAASDTEYDWPWYGKLVGGYFLSHPEVQNADIHVCDHTHSATQHLPEVWTRQDEWYDFRDLHPETNVLMTVDETSYQGGKMGEYHPVSWYHAYDGGRAFYTALGHTKAAFDEEMFMLHLLGGIQYAIGTP